MADEHWPGGGSWTASPGDVDSITGQTQASTLHSKLLNPIAGNGSSPSPLSPSHRAAVLGQKACSICQAIACSIEFVALCHLCEHILSLMVALRRSNLLG